MGLNDLCTLRQGQQCIPRLADFPRRAHCLRSGAFWRQVSRVLDFVSESPKTKQYITWTHTCMLVHMCTPTHLIFLWLGEKITWLKSETHVDSLKVSALSTATAESLQSCPTLCDPIDGSPPGSPIPGILQARTLEWVAISFSNAWKWKVKVKLLSHARLLATPWTGAYQAPPSMGSSRQEYWSGVPCKWHTQAIVGGRKED